MTDLAAANRTYHVAQSHMELLPNYYAWTFGLFRPWLAGIVVELGCGAGLGLPHYADLATHIHAVDHNEALMARVRALALPNVTAMQADLMADRWPEFDGITADAVLMMDVLEHFADDARFLAGAARLLRPGGHVLVKVPAQSARYSSMDEASGHYRRYDPADIEALAAAAGLTVVKLVPINRLGGIAYRMKNGARSNFSKSFARWQLQAINLGLPLVRAFDHLPVAGGLSLAAVLRKG